MNKIETLTHCEILNNKAVNSIIGVAFFALATVMASYVRIPVIGSPVPITLGTFFALLSGAVLGRKLGILSQIAIFAPMALYVAGPTGGYMAGFVAASFIVGSITEKKNLNIFQAVAVLALGNAIIYTFGMLHLIFVYHMSAAAAFTAGALPFVPGDIAKICIAAVIYTKISSRTKAIFLS